MNVYDGTYRLQPDNEINLIKPFIAAFDGT